MKTTVSCRCPGVPTPLLITRSALVCAFGAERNREVHSDPSVFENDEAFFFGLPLAVAKGGDDPIEAGRPDRAREPLPPRAGSDGWPPMTNAHLTLALLAGFALVSCDRKEPSPPPPLPSSSAAASAGSAAPEAALARAQGAAQKLGGALKTRLTEVLGKEGAGKAIEICAAEAQATAASVQKETGVTVGRSSTRLRNPADAPPPWVNDWLVASEGKKAADVKGIRAVADTPAGKVARFLKPIELEAGCLACHGDAATLAPEVKAVLAAKYPADKATGYQVGDLRGALWAEARIDR